MNKKKEVFIIIIATVLTFGVPIQTWADSNDSLVSNDVVFFDERDFEGIVEQILNIKSEHPEWMEQQVEDAMDVNAPGKSAMRSGIIDIWNSLTDSEKKLVIRYPFDALKVNQAKNIATTQTETKFGVNGLGNKSDAFRHGIWNAEMTYLIGKPRQNCLQQPMKTKMSLVRKAMASLKQSTRIWICTITKLDVFLQCRTQDLQRMQWRI